MSGFLTNGNDFFMVDNFSLEPLPCINEEAEPASLIIPPICSRYREDFWGIAEMAWKVKNI